MSKNLISLFKAICLLIRPYSTAYGLLIGLAGALVGTEPVSSGVLLHALLVAFCFPAGMVTLHDFVHRRQDAKAGRNRDHAPALMFALSTSLLLGALLVGMHHRGPTVGWILGCFLVGAVYSKTKSVPLISNLVRGASSATLLMATASMAGHPEPAVGLAVAVGLLDGAGNIWGDVRDAVVDRRVGVRTIAVVAPRLAIFSALALYALALLLFAQYWHTMLIFIPGAFVPMMVPFYRAHLWALIVKYAILGTLCIHMSRDQTELLLSAVLFAMLLPSAFIYCMIHTPPRKKEDPMNSTNKTVESIKRVLIRLVHEVKSGRAKENIHYKKGLFNWPPKIYEHIEGLWPSDHVPYVDGRSQSRIRTWIQPLIDRMTTCIDYNFYASVWILQNILKAQDLSTELEFDDSNLKSTVLALTERFRDPGGVPAGIFFWPKRIPTEQGDRPAVYPTNLMAKFRAVSRVARAIFKLLNKLGLEKWGTKKFYIISPARFRGLLSAMKLPADMDDSSLYLSVGLFIAARTERYPATHQQWPVYLKDYAQQLLRCAYRPFSSDAGAATIDPRTYYWMRDFLERAQAEAMATGAPAELVLPTTWIQTFNETREAAADAASPYVVPLYVNNVDIAVCANVLHALSAGAIAAPGDWFDAHTQKLYLDTARLLCWAITSGVVEERADLALLYYPDIQTFYWFVARSLGELRGADSTADSSRAALERVRQLLEHALAHASQRLVDTAGEDGQGGVFWDGVIGGGKDRMYVTAAAANALFEIWTTESQGRLRFLADAPQSARRALHGACLYLSEHAGDPAAGWRNAFFSGSVKSIWLVHGRFPANVFMYSDGRPIDVTVTKPSQLRNAEWTAAMRGVISSADYEKLVAKLSFGLQRRPFSNFRHWSVPDAARSMCMLALSRYLAISSW